MKNLGTRLTVMEKLLPPSSGNPQDCGKGVPVPKGTPPQAHRCATHGHECWRREDAYDLAQAAVILEALKKRDYAGMDAEPSPELIEEARQAILAKGVELFTELEKVWDEQ
ncbi:MAG TPA: hypothetical protein VFA32_02915 [Dehalococcoidia bacterium]|nr:hypothetical protein [Dehalococcoidia bacterium]